MKKIILFLLLGSSLIPALSQSYQENLEKYWHLRKRFTDHFIYRAEPQVQGSNIPAEYIQIVHPRLFLSAHIGDATFNLGHYVGMLAMEYRLLKDNNQDYSETLRDLHWALDTYKRLDQKAELFWGGSEETINGFYLRDDVNEFDSIRCVELGVHKLESDYGNGQPIDPKKNAPSQDQAWASYLGLALVKACVDDESIQAKRRDVAYWLVKGMQGLVPGAVWMWIVLWWDEAWIIENPITGRIHQSPTDLRWLKYGHDHAARFVADQTMSWAGSQNDLSKGLFTDAQNVWLHQYGTAGSFKFNAYGIAVLSLVGNKWGEGEDNLYNWLARVSDDLKAGMHMDSGAFIHLPAIAKIVHGYDGNKLISRGTYEYFLNSAPPCGAFSYIFDGDTCRSEPPWHTRALFSPWHNDDNYSERSMLDYLLLYNAYFLVYNTPRKPYLHFSGFSFYPLLSPRTQTAAREIEAENHILGGEGTTTYQAGQTIRLVDGFSVKASDHYSFTGKIDSSLNNPIYYQKTETDPCGVA